MDVGAVLAGAGLALPASVSQEASAAVLAFGLYKLCQPLRFGVTFVATPVVVRTLREAGYEGWPLPPSTSPSRPRAQQQSEQEGKKGARQEEEEDDDAAKRK